MRVLLQAFRASNSGDATWIAVTDATEATRQYLSFEQGWDARGVYSQVYDSAEDCDRGFLRFASSMLGTAGVVAESPRSFQVRDPCTDMDLWQREVLDLIRCYVPGSGPITERWVVGTDPLW